MFCLKFIETFRWRAGLTSQHPCTVAVQKNGEQKWLFDLNVASLSNSAGLHGSHVPYKAPYCEQCPGGPNLATPSPASSAGRPMNQQ